MSKHNGTPLRFKVIVPKGTDTQQGLEERFGVYFPASDLLVTDMGVRRTGIPEGSNIEWIDDPKHLPWYNAGGFEGSKSKTFEP